jgi:LCP family protein required for cell wall assembly
LAGAPPRRFTPAHQQAGFSQPGYETPGGRPQPYQPMGGPPHPRRRRRKLPALLVIVLLLLAWPAGLALWANSKLQHVDALSPGGDDSGRTYLIAGSDKRGTGGIDDGTEGSRADTIMLLHVPPQGPPSLLSLPRDTYVEIPGYGGQKINAAYAFGGPKLLVETVQNLTGIHVDHYAEVGFGALTNLVDAIGGIELCYDATVDDQNSKLNWTAGCHKADGATALAFSRMRYSDPLGDIGRALRQRQVVAQIAKQAFNPKELLWPPDQVSLINAGTGAIDFDQDMNILDVARLALDFKKATGPDGVSGTPTIETLDYRPGNIGSAVKLNDEAAQADFKAIIDGTWPGSK